MTTAIKTAEALKRFEVCWNGDFRVPLHERAFDTVPECKRYIAKELLPTTRAWVNDRLSHEATLAQKGGK